MGISIIVEYGLISGMEPKGIRGSGVDVGVSGGTNRRIMLNAESKSSNENVPRNGPSCRISSIGGASITRVTGHKYGTY